MQAILSPAGLIRLELSVETVWVGMTVYPSVAVWRVWYDGRPVVATSFFRLAGRGEPIAYGMTLTGVRDRSPERAAVPSTLCDAHWVDRSGRGFAVTFALIDQRPDAADPFRLPRLVCSWAIKPDESAEGLADESFIAFPDGSQLIQSDAGDAPMSLFSPDGKVIAVHRRPMAGQLLFFDRPGDLAVSRTPLMEKQEVWEVADPREALTELFSVAPFLPAVPHETRFLCGGLTPAFMKAYAWMIGAGDSCGMSWMMRGEPGGYAVWARCAAGVWRVACASATERVLTVRLEDLMRRTPGATPEDTARVELLRDPNKSEGTVGSVSETFDAVAFDANIVLEVKAGGGFFITVRENEK